MDHLFRLAGFQWPCYLLFPFEAGRGSRVHERSGI